MSADGVVKPPWVDRVTTHSPAVERSRLRSIEQAGLIIQGARRLIAEKGASFTTQELVREAGIAMKTFYRHFPGKDQLLLAVIEDVIAEHVGRLEEGAREIADPIDRVRHYVVGAMMFIDGGSGDARDSRFIAAEHWRLYQLYPDEVARARAPFADLVVRDLQAAQNMRLCTMTDARQAAAIISTLMMSMFQIYAFQPRRDTSMEEIGNQVWDFCLRGIGFSPSGGGEEATDAQSM